MNSALIVSTNFRGGGINNINMIAVASSTPVNMAVSENGSQWISASNQWVRPVGNANGVAWNGSNLWVAVGSVNDNSSSPTILTSSNGLNWTPSINNVFVNGQARGIAHNGSIWVAVGFNNNFSVTIASSSDGSNWTPSVNNPFGGQGQGRGIAWNGFYWCAVGYGATTTIATSTNGSNWTSALNNPFPGGYAHGIAWNGSLWVVTASPNSSGAIGIATSSDGLTWTLNNNNIFGTFATINAIAWNGSLWVVTASAAPIYSTVSIATSTDGSNWTSANDSPFLGGGGYGIMWDGFYWFAVGYGYYNSSYIPIITKSSDGSNWTNINNPFTGGFVNGIASKFKQYLNPSTPVIKYVTAGTANSAKPSITVSSNGLNWLSVPNDPYIICYSVKWNGSYWLAYGMVKIISGTRFKQFATSPDGWIWTLIPDNKEPSQNGYTDINSIFGWNGSYWLTDGVKNGIQVLLSSENGLDWMERQAPLLAVRAIEWNGSYWCAVGGDIGHGTIHTSSNGSNWTLPLANNPMNGGDLRGIAWNGSYWCAVGANGSGTSTVISYNGSNWITLSTDPYNQGYGAQVGWNGFYWCSLGVNNNFYYIYTSTDGSNWTNRGLVGYVFMLPRIFWDGSLWFINTVTHIYLTSSNGINFIPNSNNLYVGKTAVNVYSTVAKFSTEYFFRPPELIMVGGSGRIIASRSINGINWAGFNPWLSNSYMYPSGHAIAWNGDYWIIAGNGVISKSEDGLSWTILSNGPLLGKSFLGIAWNGSYWLIVGSTSQDSTNISAATSINGLSWTATSINPFGIGRGSAVAWNGSYWLISGTNNDGIGTVAKTSDTLSWTTYTFDGILTDFYPTALAWNGSFWLLVGGNPGRTIQAIQSLDGLIWSVSSNPFPPSLFNIGTIPNGIAWNGSYWLAVGAGFSSKSPDAINWTYSNIFTRNGLPVLDGNAQGVTWTGSYWCVAANSGLRETAAISTDGLTWTSSSAFNQETAAFAVGSKFTEYLIPQSSIPNIIAVGSVPAMAISANGSQWTSNNTPWIGAVIGRGVAWSGSLWVAVGDGNNGSSPSIITSSNGLVWTPSVNNIFSNGAGYGIAYNGSLWVAVGINTNPAFTIASSRDGSNWTASVNNPFTGGGGSKVAWNGYLWVAVGRNVNSSVTVASSRDGSNWSPSVNNPFLNGTGYGIAWNGRVWVAVGTTSTPICISTSYDGSNWVFANNNPFGNSVRGVAWNGNLWVVTATNTGVSTASIGTSPDGSNWTAITDNPFFNATGSEICWDGYNWIAVGSSNDGSSRGIILKSSNAINWSNINNPFKNFIIGVSSRFIQYLVPPPPTAPGAPTSVTALAGDGQATVSWTAPGSNGGAPIIRYTVTSSPGGITATYTGSGSGSIAVTGLTNGTPYTFTVTATNIVEPGPASTASSPPITPVGRPSAPKDVSAAAVDGGATVSWTLPDSNGGSIILSYTVTSSPDGITATYYGAGSGSILVTPLRTGISYTFTVTATNAVGTGPASTASLPKAYYPQTIIVGLSYVEGYASVYSTVDLEYWTRTNASFGSSSAHGIAWNGTYWVVVGVRGYAKSTDGLNWSPTTSIFGGREIVYGIAWNGSYWVAVGQSQDNPNTIAKSTDTITWEISLNNPFNSLGSSVKRVAWNGTYWVAVGHDSGYSVTIARSADGLTWTAANNPFPSGARANDVAYGNGLWVVVGNLLTIATSTDGLIWTAANNTFGSGEANGVAWNGSLWVVVGRGTGNSVAIATSTNGLNWTRTTNIADGTDIISAVAWNGYFWIAVLERSVRKVIISLDGTTWSATNGFDLFSENSNPFVSGFVFGVASRFIQYLVPPPV